MFPKQNINVEKLLIKLSDKSKEQENQGFTDNNNKLRKNNLRDKSVENVKK